MLHVLTFCLVLSMLGCNKISFLAIGTGGGDDDDDSPVVTAASPEELFVLGTAARSPLDILMVIDNSNSMAEVHRGLADKLDVLLGEVKDNDWQIAITTTDPRDCPQTLISAATPNYTQAFHLAVSKLGTGGTILEQASRAARLGLEKDCRGKEWLRADSAVAVLIITDEDNFERGPCGMVDSSGLSITEPLDDSECHVSALHAYLQKIRIPGVTAKVYGLINTSNDGAHSKNFLTWKDSRGKPIFDHHASVHAKDYTATLRKISQHIHDVLQNRFVLQETHPEKSAKVFFTTGKGEAALQPDAYNISGNILTLKTNTIPPDARSLRIVWTENE